jgi:hypothetical protein
MTVPTYQFMVTAATLEAVAAAAAAALEAISLLVDMNTL